jgi:ribosome-binding factor A
MGKNLLKGEKKRSGSKKSNPRGQTDLAFDKPPLQSQKLHENSHRPVRVAEIIRHLLSDILLKTHFRDPELAHSEKITISEVQMTPDLKTARVLIYPLSSLLSKEQHLKEVQTITKALNRASGFLRSALAKHITQKHVPALLFFADERFDHASRIHLLIKNNIPPLPHNDDHENP